MHEWFESRINEKKLNPKFKFLLNFQYTSERELLTSWIERFKIKDGVDKTINQFQETFHSVFWEVYLNEVFSSLGYKTDENVVSPDFCLLVNEGKIYIEAVVSNVADSEPKEAERTSDDVYGDNDHYKILDESIVRLYNSFIQKHTEYVKNYSNTPCVKESPFVLAIGDYAQINYGQSFYYPLLALLYGAYYDKDDIREDLLILGEDDFGKEYKYLESHIKKNGAKLKVGLFDSSEYSHISAVIYSCTTTLGKLSSLSEDHVPLEKFIVLTRQLESMEYDISRYSKQQPDENLYDGIFVYHNPHAAKKLPEEFMAIAGVTHVSFDESSEVVISLQHDRKRGVLKRRQVSMKGVEDQFVKNFHDLVPMLVKRR